MVDMILIPFKKLIYEYPESYFSSQKCEWVLLGAFGNRLNEGAGNVQDN